MNTLELLALDDYFNSQSAINVLIIGMYVGGKKKYKN